MTQKKYSNKIIIYLSPIQIQKFNRLKEELDLSSSNTIATLIEEYYSLNIRSIKNFRYNLIKRVRLGISKMYLKELIALRDYLDTVIERIT